MASSGYIKVDGYEAAEDGTVTYFISFPRSLKKYLRADRFYVKYDFDPSDTPESLMYVPAAASLAGLSWTVGADLIVPSLDATYIESLGKVKEILRGWHPDLSFEGSLRVGDVASNSWDGARKAILFSGGLDSTYTYTVHRVEAPFLVTVFGSDVPANRSDKIRIIRGMNSEFAEAENTGIGFIETDLLNTLNTGLLNWMTRRFFNYVTWWQTISICVALTGLTAPLCYMEGLGTVYTSSGIDMNNICPTGIHPEVDPLIRWGSTRVANSGFNVTRIGKTKYIKEHYVEPLNRSPFLRVCNFGFLTQDSLNCSCCEKCRRTIMGLASEGLDPAEFGFDVFDGFFDETRRLIESGKLLTDSNCVYYWENIQRNIDPEAGYSLYDAGPFFEWLNGYDLSPHRKERLKNTVLKDYLMRATSNLPRGVRDRLREVYNQGIIS